MEEDIRRARLGRGSIAGLPLLGNSPFADVTVTKAELRRIGLMRRESLDAEARVSFASSLASVASKLVSDHEHAFGPATTALYSAIGSEPDMVPLARGLHARGAPVALPVDHSSGAPLVYRRWTHGDILAAGPLGISEPLEAALEVEPDVIVVPMVAFDRVGGRLGYGAGNVDSTLRALRSRKRLLVIGVAYSVQETATVPTTPHDEPVDIVVTDREVIECRV